MSTQYILIIEKLKSKFKLNNISILVRAIFQTREFEERFLKIGLPYRIIGGIKFYDRAEIKDLPLLFIFLFTACEFEDLMSDDELIDAIINAEEKIQILESDLPIDA